jgi:hypothetical protein
MAVSRLIHVSLVEQTFTVEAQMEVSWVDNSIGPVVESANLTHSDGTPLTVGDLIVDEKHTDQAAGILRFEQLSHQFFAPRLKFNNCIEYLKREAWFELFHTGDENTVVCMRWKFVGVLQEILELQKFPLDVQKLTMELRCSWEKDKRTVRLVKNQSSKYKSLVNTRSFVQQSEYMLSDLLAFENASSLPEESSSNKVCISNFQNPSPRTLVPAVRPQTQPYSRQSAAARSL